MDKIDYKDNVLTIYHYTNEYTLLEHIIPTLELKFGTVKKFNDPYESIFRKCYINSLKTQEFLENKNTVQSIVDIDSIFNDIFSNQFYIASFCIDSKLDDFNKVTFFDNEYQFGYSKLRMWSQYANNQRGVCIAFNKERLIKSINKSLDIQREKIYWDKIKYLDHPLNYESLSINYIEYCNSPFEYINEHIHKNIDGLLFRKTRDWETENEYRIAIYKSDSKENSIFIDISDSIEALYLGIDFPMNYIELVKKHFNKVFKLEIYNGDIRKEEV